MVETRLLVAEAIADGAAVEDDEESIDPEGKGVTRLLIGWFPTPVPVMEDSKFGHVVSVVPVVLMAPVETPHFPVL